uniref:Uncharacterized protein n=1 Tax=Heterorhabditis bacteriophora TaxID=37862 RepID=A0A1I7WXE8_HETBA
MRRKQPFDMRLSRVYPCEGAVTPRSVQTGQTMRRQLGHAVYATAFSISLAASRQPLALPR